MTCIRCIALLACAIAAILLLAGWSLPSLISSRLHQGILEQTIWKPDSPPEVYDRFISNNNTGDSKDYVRYYLFNITNIEAVRNGSKPELEELGPFTYEKVYVKLDVWFSHDGKVSYKEYVHQTWVPELSVGDPKHFSVVTLNVPLVGVLNTLHATFSQSWVDLVVAMIERQSDTHTKGLFTLRSAYELLWGYEDPLLKMLSTYVPSAVPSAVFQLVQVQGGPEEVLGGPATIADTGLLNISMLGNIEADGGVSEVSSWACPEVVRGTDATQFPPGLTEGDSVWVWVAELYRSAQLVVRSRTQLYGVDLLRFWPNPEQGKLDPCHFQSVEGLMNISSPTAGGMDGPPGQPGPPLFLSLPHFCLADPVLAEGVEGLDCNDTLHVTYLDVEPITGMTMRAAKRLMLSSQAGISGIKIDPHVNGSTVLPIFWAEESSAGTEEQLEGFKSTVYRAQWWIAALQVQPLIAAGGLALVALILLLTDLNWNQRRRHRRADGPGAPDALEPLLDDEPPPDNDLESPAPPSVLPPEAPQYPPFSPPPFMGFINRGPTPVQIPSNYPVPNPNHPAPRKPIDSIYKTTPAHTSPPTLTHMYTRPSFPVQNDVPRPLTLASPPHVLHTTRPMFPPKKLMVPDVFEEDSTTHTTHTNSTTSPHTPQGSDTTTTSSHLQPATPSERPPSNLHTLSTLPTPPASPPQSGRTPSIGGDVPTTSSPHTTAPQPSHTSKHPKHPSHHAPSATPNPASSQFPSKPKATPPPSPATASPHPPPQKTLLPPAPTVSLPAQSTLAQRTRKMLDWYYLVASPTPPPDTPSIDNPAPAPTPTPTPTNDNVPVHDTTTRAPPPPKEPTPPSTRPPKEGKAGTPIPRPAHEGRAVMGLAAVLVDSPDGGPIYRSRPSTASSWRSTDGSV